MTNELKREWYIRDRAGNGLESILAATPEEAFEKCVSSDKYQVARPGELEGWVPGLMRGDVYAAFRDAGFSHTDCARAMVVMGFSGGSRAQRPGELTADQLALVLKVKKWPLDVQQAWVEYTLAVGVARQARIEAQLAEDSARAKLVEFLNEPVSAAETEKRGIEKMNAWWEAEGKYEAELEDRGESKSYFYACECADRLGEERPTPKAFAQGTADEVRS